MGLQIPTTGCRSFRWSLQCRFFCKSFHLKALCKVSHWEGLFCAQSTCWCLTVLNFQSGKPCVRHLHWYFAWGNWRIAKYLHRQVESLVPSTLLSFSNGHSFSPLQSALLVVYHLLFVQQRLHYPSSNWKWLRFLFRTFLPLSYYCDLQEIEGFRSLSSTQSSRQWNQEKHVAMGCSCTPSS